MAIRRVKVYRRGEPIEGLQNAVRMLNREIEALVAEGKIQRPRGLTAYQDVSGGVIRVEAIYLAPRRDDAAT